MATTCDGDDDHCGLDEPAAARRRWHPAVVFKEQAVPYRQPINIMLGSVIEQSDRAPAEYDPTATV
jgi:hypothetical protein